MFNWRTPFQPGDANDVFIIVVVHLASEKLFVCTDVESFFSARARLITIFEFFVIAVFKILVITIFRLFVIAVFEFFVIVFRFFFITFFITLVVSTHHAQFLAICRVELHSCDPPFSILKCNFDSLDAGDV